MKIETTKKIIKKKKKTIKNEVMEIENHKDEENKREKNN